MAERLSFTWSLERRGNDGYVHESRSDGETQCFGPMPPHTVPHFARARQRFVAIMMERLGHSYVPEELSDSDLKMFQ